MVHEQPEPIRKKRSSATSTEVCTFGNGEMEFVRPKSARETEALPTHFRPQHVWAEIHGRLACPYLFVA